MGIGDLVIAPQVMELAAIYADFAKGIKASESQIAMARIILVNLETNGYFTSVQKQWLGGSIPGLRFSVSLDSVVLFESFTPMSV